MEEIARGCSQHFISVGSSTKKKNNKTKTKTKTITVSGCEPLVGGGEEEGMMSSNMFSQNKTNSNGGNVKTTRDRERATGGSREWDYPFAFRIVVLQTIALHENSKKIKRKNEVRAAAMPQVGQIHTKYLHTQSLSLCTHISLTFGHFVQKEQRCPEGVERLSSLPYLHNGWAQTN